MNAFETFKRKLTEAPTLSIYNPDNPTELHCDASSQRFGAVLLQESGQSFSSDLLFFEKNYYRSRITLSQLSQL